MRPSRVRKKNVARLSKAEIGKNCAEAKSERAVPGRAFQTGQVNANSARQVATIKNYVSGDAMAPSKIDQLQPVGRPHRVFPAPTPKTASRIIDIVDYGKGINFKAGFTQGKRFRVLSPDQQFIHFPVSGVHVRGVQGNGPVQMFEFGVVCILQNLHKILGSVRLGEFGVQLNGAVGMGFAQFVGLLYR